MYYFVICAIFFDVSSNDVQKCTQAYLGNYFFIDICYVIFLHIYLWFCEQVCEFTLYITVNILMFTYIAVSIFIVMFTVYVITVFQSVTAALRYCGFMSKVDLLRLFLWAFFYLSILMVKKIILNSAKKYRKSKIYVLKINSC